MYPFLKRIVDKTYKGEIALKSTFRGAHDANWFKEYELFYEKQPNSTPYVTRLFFKFNEKRGKKAGFCDVRPISDGSEVSETYLVPPKHLSLSNRCFIKCLATHDIYGESIQCTPFIMPETVFGMCIQTSIWICLKILEKHRTIERSLTVPEIQMLAGGSPYADKKGLLFVQAARLIRMCRTSSFYINSAEPPCLTDKQMLMELYAYVESCLPVVIGADIVDLPWWQTSSSGYHSIVAIGHTMKGNSVDGFIFHDESQFPYLTLKDTELLKAWHVPKAESSQDVVREMLVAVPPQVALPFHEVYHEFEELATMLVEKGLTKQTIAKLTVQPILKESPQLFIGLDSGRRQFMQAMRDSGFPRYVWIFNLFEPDLDNDKRNVKGFFARDATGKTEFRFFYFEDDKQAIYQTGNRVYRHRDGRKLRNRLV